VLQGDVYFGVHCVKSIVDRIQSTINVGFKNVEGFTYPALGVNDTVDFLRVEFEFCDAAL
jgi:hypothetical protein